MSGSYPAERIRAGRIRRWPPRDEDVINDCPSQVPPEMPVGGGPPWEGAVFIGGDANPRAGACSGDPAVQGPTLGRPVQQPDAGLSKRTTIEIFGSPVLAPEIYGSQVLESFVAKAMAKMVAEIDSDLLGGYGDLLANEIKPGRHGEP